MKIRPNELRIGNLLRDSISKTPLRVVEIKELGFVTYVIDRTKYPLANGWSCEPIPLTEEILLKAGFEYWGGYKHKLLRGVRGAVLCEVDDEYWLLNNSYKSLYVKFKYLHQLQNLVFSLSGKELEIEL